jgi:hypothetical protein
MSDDVLNAGEWIRGGIKMKAGKVLRRIASFRQRGVQPVAEYVANLPSEMERLVIDLLTLPERRALENLRKLRNDRRRARATLEEQQRTDCQESVAAEAAAREAKFAAFVGQLILHRASGDAARIAAASQYTQRELASLLTPAERDGCRSYRRGEILTSRACELLGCSITELNRWTSDGRLMIFRTRAIHGLPKKVIGRTFIRAEVERATVNVESWRKQDSIRKVYRRRGLRAV